MRSTWCGAHCGMSLMATRPPVEYTVDQRAIHVIRDAMTAEADGKALRRDLLREMRSAARPLVPDLQSAVRSLPDVSPAFAEPSLREAVAQQITVGARLTGRSTGVKVAVGTKKDPRGFRFAGRKLNRRSGWKHPVYGNREAWVTQTGREWFEPTILQRREEMQRAVMDAVEAMARRIAARAERGDNA